MKKTLYQLNGAGKVKVWAIEVIKHNHNHSDIVICHGQEGGKMQDDITPITFGKNFGKANETDAHQQAVKDAETEFNKKVKKGYVEDKAQIKAKGQTHSLNEPMKGFPYHPKGKEMRAKTLDDLKLKGKKVGFQRKFDGHRFRLKVRNDGVTFYSSGGDVVPSFPHIENALLDTFWKFYPSDAEIILDGEIYSHKEGFQAVASACGTRVHITSEKAALRAKMEFHLFDIVSDLPYAEGRENRRNLIKKFYGGPIVKVETIYDECTDENIEKYFQQFLSEGFEGLMFRTLDEPYEFKRTKQLTKYKPFIDEEYQVIGFKKSITGDTLGSIECKMVDGTKFYANPMGEVGSDKARQEIWNDKDSYIGKWLNCRFLEYSDDNVPRHPRAMYFRKGKSKD